MAREQITYRSPSYYEIGDVSRPSWRDFRGPDYAEYRRLWEERPALRDPGPFPLHIDIDPTNACNLKCTMCPRTHYLESGNTSWAPDGKIGYMDWKLFTTVIDQAAANGAYSIKLNFLGEPLLHPQVVQQIAYAHDRGLEVMMNTNATLLTPKLSRQLLEAGLDDIFFSVDSPYPEEYQRIRRGANFHQVIHNIGRFVEIKDNRGFRHVQTRVSMVLPPLDRDSAQARQDFKDLFLCLGVSEIGFALPTDMKLDYWETYGPLDGFVCRDPYHRMFIFWDGKIGPCCGEWERRFLVGDARTEKLEDVWHNKIYQTLRQAHEQGRYHKLGTCRQCSVPWLSRQEVPA
jgi:radical SAM protein with 4Fe4S-binding SPASM domain